MNIFLEREDLENLVRDILIVHNTGQSNAEIVARALVQAQVDEQFGHGISRVPAYSAQAKVRKVNGYAEPSVVEVGAAAIRVDAKNGFAFPAIELAITDMLERAKVNGIAIATIYNSHHMGVAGLHVEKLANDGLVALIVSNAPKAIAPWGGSRGVFGTNPIAFSAPRKDNPPLVIDLSLSKVARGKVMLAKKLGKDIPDDWALDIDGNPTSDPEIALQGTMLPMGGAKGAALILMVEILAAALSGSQFAFEASSLFDAKGPPPSLGHTLIAINPDVVSGGLFSMRLETLIEEMLSQPGVRLPGERRLNARKQSEDNGVGLAQELYDEIQGLC